jgi:hypothetical protein
MRSSPVDDAFDAPLATAAKEDEDDHKSAVSRLRSAGNAHYVQSSDKVDLLWNASTDNVGVAATVDNGPPMILTGLSPLYNGASERFGKT